MIKDELGEVHVGIPGFFSAFFEGVADLRRMVQAVFDKCKGGDNPLYREDGGWKD